MSSPYVHRKYFVTNDLSKKLERSGKCTQNFASVESDSSATALATEDESVAIRTLASRSSWKIVFL